jgi:hypothetical protein
MWTSRTAKKCKRKNIKGILLEEHQEHFQKAGGSLFNWKSPSDNSIKDAVDEIMKHFDELVRHDTSNDDMFDIFDEPEISLTLSLYQLTVLETSFD